MSCFLNLTEIKAKLQSIPELSKKVAYYSSRRELTTPYCLFYRNSTSDIGSDLRPSDLKEQEIIIELYTDRIDPVLEEKVEKLFSDFDIQKSENWINDTKEYLIRYSFTQYIK